MAPRNSGALVVGYRLEDPRRYAERRAAESRARGRFIRTPSGALVPAEGVVRMRARDLDCEIDAGRCISCGQAVYLNSLGYSAVLERDADVCCMQCEDRYSADITRSL
jgi:hypothetical protein